MIPNSRKTCSEGSHVYVILNYENLSYFFPEERAEDWSKDVDERVQYGVDYGKKYGFIKSGQQVICVTGWRQGAGSSNTVRIL